MKPVENEVVEGTGNDLVDNLIVQAILQAQRAHCSAGPAAIEAAEALHGAVTRWNTLVKLEVPE